MSKQRKFVQHLSHCGLIDSKSSDNDVVPNDSFSNFKISCVIEPIDYEQYLVRNKASIMNDPYKDLVLFPPDDVKIVRLQRILHNCVGGAPPSASVAELAKANALVRHVEATCMPPTWCLVQEPFVRFRGAFCDLPKDPNVLELMGKPSEQWYAVDHLVERTSRGVFTSGRSTASATNQISSSNGIANGRSSGSASRLWTSARRLAIQATRDASGSNATSRSTDHVRSPITNTSTEAEVTICTRAEYQSYRRARETALACGAAEQPVVVVPTCYRLILRQLTVDDLGWLRHRNSTTMTSSSLSHPSLPLGLHLIVPSDWGLRQPSSCTAVDYRNVIFLDAIESVSGIGRHWLRLDRHTGTQIHRIASDRFDSFFSSSSATCDEVYLCFQSVETRNTWVGAVKLALDAEQARLRLGYSVANGTDNDVDDSGETKDRKRSLESRYTDGDSLRSALQRFSQENELFVSHQRQRDRLNLLSVCPDVQIAYRNQPSSECARRRQQITDLLENVDKATMKALPSVRKFLPECAHNESKRRFLVTCLSLKTGLRASIEGASGTSEVDNPEPFFVTFFLASTADGGTRLSEDFSWNPNSPLLDAMLAPDVFRHLPWHTSDTPTVPPTHSQLTNRPPGLKSLAPPPPIPLNLHGSLTATPSKLAKCRSALLSIDPAIHINNLFLVFRVDKVLTGSVSQVAEKYMKVASGFRDNANAPAPSDLKAGAALHKSMQSYCKLLGRYRMPFAWGIRWLLSKETQVPLFKMDSSKVSEPALLQSFRQLARLLIHPSKEMPPGEGAMGSDVVMSITPAVIETVEKSIKTELLPMHLQAAVNEVSGEVVSNCLSNLVSSQLVAAASSANRGALGGSGIETARSINLPCVNDFSSDEVVKELQIFTTRKLRAITRRQPYGAFDPVLFDESIGFDGTRHTFLPFGDYKRDSLSSFRSESSVSCVSSAISNGSTTASAVTDSVSATGRFLHFYKTSTLDHGGTAHDGAGADGQAASTVAIEETDALFTRAPLSLIDPYDNFVHNLYVYPRALNLNVKHVFARARNLCCFIELRESDEPDSKPLKVFYTRPSTLQPPFDTWFGTAVVHHNSSPTFLDEAKVCLPIVLTWRHHLLFRFYHVRCDLSSNSSEKNANVKKALETPTGFAWLPILNEDGSLTSGTVSLPVSQDLPAGYLKPRSASTDHQSSLQFTHKGGVEPSWLDNKRALFTVALEPVSTMYTLDSKLAHFFDFCASKLTIYTVPVGPTNVGNSSPAGTKGVRFVTDKDKASVLTRPSHPSEAVSHLDTTTGKFLCNAMKSLLLVESYALVQFFPALANQILEVLLVSSSMSQLNVKAVRTKSEEANQWLALCQNMVPGSACDVAKTAVGTLSLILCIVRDALLDSTAALSLPGSKASQHILKRPILVKNFLEFSLDPRNLCSSAADTHKINNSVSGALSLHHAVVRGMIVVMVDSCCPSEIAHRFLVNAWFFFDVVFKSLAQHLTSLSRYSTDRRDWGCPSDDFKTDLTILLRLIGNWMAKLCKSECNGAFNVGSFSSGIDHQAADTSKAAETLGCELVDSTADFLEQLLLLIDRGFVLQRLRDLLTLVEIRHSMSPNEVERFNCLRYRLLQRFTETQFFVQINLPSLSPHLSDRREEFSLNERFCEEHFVVGLVLQQVACVLGGCADAGGVVSGRSLRQPLLHLLSQLAKVTFDPRYSSSHRLRSRIHMLYLPLVKIALENIRSLGPPGLHMLELEKVCVREASASADNNDGHEHKQRKPRTSHKLRKLHVNNSSNHLHLQQTGKKVSTTSPTRPESLTTLSDGSIGSFSLGITSTSNLSNSSSSSSLECKSSSRSTASGSSAFIGSNGRVAPEVLKQIAGFNKGGSLQRAAAYWRLPDETAPRSAAKMQFGSTSTLTETGGGGGGSNNGGDDTEEAENGTGDLSLYYFYANGGGGGEEDSLRSDIDYNSDIDENNGTWSDRVVNATDVLSPEKLYVTDDTLRPPIPSRMQGVKTRLAASQLPQSLTEATSQAALSSSSSPNSRFRFQLEHFDYAYRRHIHRRPHSHLLSSQYLNDKCQRDLYICLLQILSNLTDETIAALLRILSDTELADFLKVLTFAIQHLKYRGRKCIARFNTISTSSVAQRGVSDSPHKSTSLDCEYICLLEANMGTEAGLIVLDVLNLMSNTFRRNLEADKPSNPIFQGILNVYVCLLSTGQSKRLLEQTFASLRVFISRFAKVLFSESTEGLARICMAGLRISNLNFLPYTIEEEHRPPSPSVVIAATAGGIVPSSSPDRSRYVFDQVSVAHVGILRLEACGLIYRMWRASFEVLGLRGFKRVHLQIIISLSKLVGDIGPEFEASLSLLHSLAEMDVQRRSSGGTIQPPDYQGPLRGSMAVSFMESIDDLIKRVRTVLTATEQMRRFGNDPYRKIDLHYSLAKSYASNPVLRRTWLEKLAELHLALKNMAEVAMAKLHIAALMAEYLNKRGEFHAGCNAFCKVSANIRTEEASQLCDPAIIELSYNQEDLLRDVTDAATALEAAGLFEALQPVYALITPVYEARRDYVALARVYHHLGRAYENTARAEASAQRIFASYFRVAFFGKAFESLAGKSYIYRAEAWQKINIFIENQVKIYEERLGVGGVEKLIENYVDPSRLSPDKAYIQVTFVEPYVPNDTSVQSTSFELHHNVSAFFFETPFIMQPGMSSYDCLLSSGPKRTDDLTTQWKRRTTLTTEAVFPHLRTRLEVVSSCDVDLSPLDGAIDAIQLKVRELTAHVPCAPQETANVSALHLSTTKNKRGLRVTTEATPAGDVGESGIEISARGEHRMPLLLDMHLQGALLPTVNQGPMAFAHAFLATSRALLHPPEKIFRLKRLFFDFLTACLVLLTRYRALMVRAHPEKYNALREAFNRYRVDLSNLLNEEVVVDEMRLQVGPKSQFTEAQPT